MARRDDDGPQFEPLTEREEEEILRQQRRRKIILGAALGVMVVLLVVLTMVYLGTTDLVLFEDQDVFRSP